MEQAKCLNNNTWVKREHKIILGHNNHDHLPTTKIMKRFNQQSSISSSLEDYQEEEAFSDGAILGAQGGSLKWPPRSYTCSFCKREFRSAQALGGHMNVHRRDRALLKQVAINSHDDDDDDDGDDLDHHNHLINPCSKSKPSDQNPSQVCSPKTNNHNNNNVVAHAHHSLSRVSSNSVLSSGISKVITTTNEGIDQDQQPNMSMGLDLAVGACLKDQEVNLHQQEFSKYSKRFKKSNDDYYNNVALFQFFDDEIMCSNVKDDDDGLKVQEVLNVRASKSIEELDLELRLGKPHQKIK